MVKIRGARPTIARGAAVLALVVGGLAGCGGDGSTDASTTTTAPDDTAASAPVGTSQTEGETSSTSTPTTTADGTTSAPTTAPVGAGAPGPGCVDGWTTPAPGTDLRTTPLDLIRGEMGIDGRFVITEMRAFTGPEVPWIIEPRPDEVRWWYVKARLEDDPSFAGRWLVAQRSEQVRGIAAVAPFDSSGYRSPDWRAFEGEGAPRPIDGLPGTWPGLEYDFVLGDDGATPGLPDEVVGCLAGS